MVNKRLVVFLVLLTFMISTTVFAASDPYFSKQWYLDEIMASDAWTTTKGSSSVVVAVLDTGVDVNHPDLASNIWVNTGEIAGDNIDNDGNGYKDDRNGYDFINNRANPEPKITGSFVVSAANHGTFVSGLISAVHNNNKGIKGVTANVKIMPLVVLNSSGMGGSSDVANAIDYAVDNGADIINLSFGGDEHSSKLKNAIVNAYNKGVLIVAAAGNAAEGETNGSDMSKKPLYPICYDQEFSDNKILGVLSSDKSNKVSAFSNYGKDCIDIAAPGEDMVSLLYHDTTYSQFDQAYDTSWNGTSFSSALVSGVAALMKSANSSITPKQIIETIMQESNMLFLNNAKWTGKAGSGVLNAKKAVDVANTLAGGQSTAPSTPSTPVVSNPSTPSAPTNTETGPVSGGAEIMVSTQKNGFSSVNFYNSQFGKKDEIELIKGDQFTGLNIQAIDIDGGGKEIVAGTTIGAQPFVRVISRTGTILSSILAFGNDFKGGVEVTAGDVDDDGEVEIIVAPQSGFSPLIRIFNLKGQLEKEFFAYNTSYKNGINIEVGDVDGDGKLEIVCAPHSGIMPKIKIFDHQGNLKKEIIAYTPQFMGGVNISVADINNDGVAEIVTGAGATGGPHVKVFKYNGTALASFFAYKASFSGGVEVEVGDWDKDGQVDIITAPGAGGGPHIKIFTNIGGFKAEFFPFSSNFTSGVNIAIM